MCRLKHAIDPAARLRGPHALDNLQLMSAPLQLGQHLFADLSLNANAVGTPLVMKMRTGECFIDGLLEVNDVNYGEQRLRDDGRPACGTHGEDGLPVP